VQATRLSLFPFRRPSAFPQFILLSDYELGCSNYFIISIPLIRKVSCHAPPPSNAYASASTRNASFGGDRDVEYIGQGWLRKAQMTLGKFTNLLFYSSLPLLHTCLNFYA